MDIIVKTGKAKGKVLYHVSSVCATPWAMAKGLMFSRKKEDFCLLFTFSNAQRASLHMWFVFYPIDCIFLDDRKRVVEVKEGFSPFAFFTSVSACRHFLEVPAGSVEKKGIRRGMELSWQNI
jgi:uncharacterized protein